MIVLKLLLLLFIRLKILQLTIYDMKEGVVYGEVAMSWQWVGGGLAVGWRWYYDHSN